MKEQMDENQVKISGTVIRIWRRGKDVFARMQTPQRTGIPRPPRFNLKFQAGQFRGESITLMPEDKLKIQGWICDEPYMETMQEFISRSKYPLGLDSGFIPAPSQDVCLKRSINAVIPEEYEVIPADLTLNQVKIEGIVARVWEHKAHKFVRLAVYHERAITTLEKGNGGRFRRIPHYVTIQFTDGQVEGRSIQILPQRKSGDEAGIAKGDRLAVSGSLAESYYSESLQSFLLGAKRIDILEAMPDASQASTIWSSYSQTVVLAEKLIRYS
jgi:hypothetical protein